MAYVTAEARQQLLDEVAAAIDRIGVGLGALGEAYEALAENEKVIEEVQAGIDRANENLARVEQIKKFKILPTDWEPGGDELTPTMKLKRKPIGEKYKDEIEALYAK